jgi:cell division septation protein DedD
MVAFSLGARVSPQPTANAAVSSQSEMENASRSRAIPQPRAESRVAPLRHRHRPSQCPLAACQSLPIEPTDSARLDRMMRSPTSIRPKG